MNEGITINNIGGGGFSGSITGLTESASYYIRAYATNSYGTSYGDEVLVVTASSGEVNSPVTGQIWMDKNLGATQVATNSIDEASYGDLYQWGRGTDGHEIRTSAVIDVLSIGDTPGHGDFIYNNTADFDWRSTQNDNLWQGSLGVNNPCPSGFAVPTDAEWDAERTSWSNNDASGAFSSPLKLTTAGFRSSADGSLFVNEGIGIYWSSTTDGTYSRTLYIDGSTAFSNYNNRADGLSVRCIKE